MSCLLEHKELENAVLDLFTDVCWTHVQDLVECAVRISLADLLIGIECAEISNDLRFLFTPVSLLDFIPSSKNLTDRSVVLDGTLLRLSL